MRMHRGSSKVARGPTPATEDLPLSASSVHVVVEITRGRSIDRRELDVASGTTIRSLLRGIDQAPEGCAVLIDDTPVPLSAPITAPLRLIVVPTFSGG
jgi:sulfur carrier protein ThiS